MAFVVGFAKALQEKSDRDYKDKTLKEDRQYERDEWTRRFNAERRGAWEDTIMKTTLTSGGGSGGRGKGGDSPVSTNPEIWIRGLAERGVDPEAIAKLAETGNNDLFRQAYEVIDEQWMSYRDEWGDDPETKQQFYTQVVSPMFNEMVMTTPSESPIFKEGFKEQITQLYGGVLPENVSRALGTTRTVPGSALMTPGLAPKSYNPAEVNTIKGIEKEALLETAVENLSKLHEELGALETQVTEGLADGTTKGPSGYTIDQLIMITRTINDHIEAAKTHGILGPLRRSYGTEVSERLNKYFRDSGQF